MPWRDIKSLLRLLLLAVTYLTLGVVYGTALLVESAYQVREDSCGPRV